MLDLKGKKFNKLQVIEFYNMNKHNSSMWLCKCDCGNLKVINGSLLKNGKIKSCGCLQKEVISKKFRKHGFWNNRIYHIWHNMNNRCNIPTDVSYKNYGAKGIKVCEQWNKSNKYAFYNFLIWSFKNNYNENLTIDRIDSSKNYEPSNCRWVSMKQQNNNKKNTIFLTYNNETHSLSEWATITNKKYGTLSSRYFRGWTTEKILTK